MASKKKIAAIVAVVVAVVVICGVVYGLHMTNAQTTNDPIPAASTEATASTVDVTVKAEGTDAETTKAQVEVLDSEGQAVIPAMEVTVNEKTALGELEPGEYSLRVVQAPVNTDGSTYVLPEEAIAFTVEDNDDGTVSLEVTLEKLNADDMSKEQLEATAKILADSGKSEASQNVTDKATTAPSRPGSAGEVSSEPTPSNPSGGNNGGGSTSKPSQPSHTHSWSAITEKRWVSNIVTIVDQEAYDEQVKQGSYVLCSCGFTCSTGPEWSEHNMNNGATHTYSVVPKYVTVHHDAITHTEDHGYYDTITTGYKCSCGATK